MLLAFVTRRYALVILPAAAASFVAALAISVRCPRWRARIVKGMQRLRETRRCPECAASFL